MLGRIAPLIAAAVVVATAAFAQVPINGAPQVLAQAQPKGAAAMPRLGTPRLYLIWNDSGAMSQDMAARALSPDGAARKNQIIASDRKLGASLQARLDAVIEAPSGIYDKVTLGIRVTSEGKTIVDQTFPVGFIDKAGRLIRAVIVNPGGVATPADTSRHFLWGNPLKRLPAAPLLATRADAGRQ